MPRARSAWLFALAAGCASPNAPELLEISEIQSETLHPGDVLRIAGRGFPAGRPSQITVRGAATHAGGRTTPVHVRVDGRATSEETVVISDTDTLLDAMEGRGTFRGTVEVAFESAVSGKVIGRSPATWTVPSYRSADIAETLRQRKIGETRARALGLSLRINDDEQGARVLSVRDSSPASEAGIEVGDRIKKVASLDVHGLEDFAAAPNAAELNVQIERRGVALPIRVSLSLPPANAEPGPQDPLRPLLWILACALFALLFVGSSARFTARSFRRLRHFIIRVPKLR